ncbi:MAG: hypothetical protein LBT39_00085, partial [Treponema sp.]|nr:hypothetical protein [Treponema sp.]
MIFPRGSAGAARNTGILVMCLVLGLLPVFSLVAQTTPVTPALGFDELPAPRSLHFPQSSTNKATMGTIGGDGDFFMSVLDWSSIKNMKNNLILAGVDEYGLAVGYAHKAGNVYLGASYSGSLIDELFRRMTNQEVATLRKEDTIRKGGSTASTYNTSLLDQDENTPVGVTISNNDINLILGAGVFGMRIGFAEYIRAVEVSEDEPYWNKEHSFESSLKPSLEMGFNFKAGTVRVKPALRAAFDFHEYSSLVAEKQSITNKSVIPAITNTFWVVQEKLINYYEPSAGITLGFDFANSDHASAELIFDADAAFRFYRQQGDTDPVRSMWYSDSFSPPPTFPIAIANLDEQY